MMRIIMKPFDAAWFYVEKPDSAAHFGPLMILSTPADADDKFVRNFVEQWRQCRIFSAPFNYRLRRNPVPAWEVLGADEIDLDYHLRHSALPQPGGERELGILISRLQSHRLDRRRPLWECHVIEGLENNRFAIYMKFHHGQLDGIGAARLMARVFSENPAARDLLPPWSVGMQSSSQSRKDAGHKRKASLGLKQTLSGFTRAFGAIADLGQEAYFGRHPEVAAPFQAPMTIFNKRIGGQRRFATQRYELSRFKLLAKSTSTTMNDVFLAISGAALRRYLLELNALPGRSLIGQLPLSIRAASDASVGNALAFIYANLGTDIDDPLERLQRVHDSTGAAKARHEQLPIEAVDTFTMLLQGPFIAQIILGVGGYMRPAANLVISNLPGPRNRLYFNGARVEQIYGPSVLFHGQALNITMSSYADEVNIGFTGCRSSLPRMQRLAVYTGEALDELEQAVQRQAASALASKRSARQSAGN